MKIQVSSFLIICIVWSDDIALDIVRLDCEALQV